MKDYIFDVILFLRNFLFEEVVINLDYVNWMIVIFFYLEMGKNKFVVLNCMEIELFIKYNKNI